MFEFEIQDLRHVRIRVGRWHFRTWRSRFMELPSAYRSPEVIYAVEVVDGEDRSVGQLGAFFSMEVAESCRSQLEAEGRTGLVINVILVHDRRDDWQFDR